MNERIILHVDMNNCFASIEMILHPEWKGLELAVCGSEKERHGIVLAKSQEAKVKGVKTGEPIWQAKLKCPGLFVVPPHYEAYLEYSQRAKKIYYEYTNQVESFGLDECWLDVTKSVDLFGSGEEMAYKIKERIKKELGLTVSIGVSFNKIFAKLGSDMKKPDAVTVINREDFKRIVWPLEVDEMLGVGRATKRKLLWLGIKNLGDLATSNPKLLRKKLGINGIYHWRHANGLDTEPVRDLVDEVPIKSIGHGITCNRDLVTDLEVRRVFQELSLDVTRRLKDNGFRARGVQIFIRDSELETTQYQMTLTYPTRSSMILTEKAMEIFKNNYPWIKPIRAVTIRAINLISEELGLQVNVFHEYRHYDKRERVDQAIYEIRYRYGRDSISFAGLMGDIKMKKDRNQVITLPNHHMGNNKSLPN